jgi:hypothetical protein
MANRLLERFELDRSIIDKLKSYGIQTVRDFLSTSSFALMIYLDISLNEVQTIILKISEKYVNSRFNKMSILGNPEIKSETKINPEINPKIKINPELQPVDN